MVSNTKHDTLKVSMFTVALPSAQSRTIGAVPARWFGLSCAESLGCVRRYGFLWLLALVHRCDICLRPPTISTRTPPGLESLLYAARELRLSAPVRAPTESRVPLNVCFARKKGWRSLVAPVATLDGAFAAPASKSPARACDYARARAPHTITTGARSFHPAAPTARLQPRRSMSPRVSPRPVLHMAAGNL